MPEPHPPAILRHHILADPTGRRRRRLANAGRAATAVLGLWLVVLILGGLGLQPLAGLPIVGGLGAREAAPPALPERVQAAVARHTTLAPGTGAIHAPVTTAPVPRLGSAVTAPSRKKTRTTPATPPVKATLGRGPASRAPSGSTTSPSTTVPGQTRTPPGQTKTEPGPPTSTPGTTPAGNGKPRTKGTVTTP
jgi:hypothetical protein